MVHGVQMDNLGRKDTEHLYIIELLEQNKLVGMVYSRK